MCSASYGGDVYPFALYVHIYVIIYKLMSQDLYPTPQLPPDSERLALETLIDLTDKRPEE